MPARQTKPKGEPTWSSPAYLAECEARSRKIRISYVDREHWVIARLVHSWKRDDAEIRHQSASPTLGAIAAAVFGESELIEQAALLVLNGMPFFICRIGPHWYDRSEPPRLVMVKLGEQ